MVGSFKGLKCNHRWSGLLGAAFLKSVATLKLYCRQLSLVEPSSLRFAPAAPQLNRCVSNIDARKYKNK